MNTHFSSGHFLQVDVIVPKANAHRFESAMKAFLKRGKAETGESFQPFRVYGDRFRLELKLALKSAKAFDFDGHSTSHPSYRRKVPAGRTVFRYVHLWTVPTLAASDLARMMANSADDDAYLAIDSQVARESQNFVYKVQWVSPVAKVRPRRPKPGSRPQFVRITRQMQSVDIGTYLFKLGTTYPALHHRGCNALGTFQNITGPLDNVIEFWQTTGRGNGLQAIESALKHLPNGVKTRMVVRPNAAFPDSEVAEAFTMATYSPG